MRTRTRSIALFFIASFSCLLFSQDMPRFRWENFSTANGLPNDHVYSVLVDGSRIWAGTDNGLGLFEGGKWKVFRPSDGLAHQAVLSLALDKRTGDVWAATLGGLSRYFCRANRQLYAAQLRPSQRRRLRRRRPRRLRLGRHCCWRRSPEHSHRPVVSLQRAQYADV